MAIRSGVRGREERLVGGSTRIATSTCRALPAGRINRRSGRRVKSARTGERGSAPARDGNSGSIGIPPMRTAGLSRAASSVWIISVSVILSIFCWPMGAGAPLFPNRRGLLAGMPGQRASVPSAELSTLRVNATRRQTGQPASGAATALSLRPLQHKGDKAWTKIADGCSTKARPRLSLHRLLRARRRSSGQLGCRCWWANVADGVAVALGWFHQEHVQSKVAANPSRQSGDQAGILTVSRKSKGVGRPSRFHSL
jgi:hypothetical protein